MYCLDLVFLPGAQFLQCLTRIVLSHPGFQFKFNVCHRFGKPRSNFKIFLLFYCSRCQFRKRSIFWKLPPRLNHANVPAPSLKLARLAICVPIDHVVTSSFYCISDHLTISLNQQVSHQFHCQVQPQFKKCKEGGTKSITNSTTNLNVGIVSCKVQPPT